MQFNTFAPVKRKSAVSFDEGTKPLSGLKEVASSEETAVKKKGKQKDCKA